MKGLSFRRWIVLSAAGALLLTLAGPVTHAAATSSTSTVTVPATQPWTSTGISLPAGEVSFSASGTINVNGGDPSGNNTPNGDGPANPSCIAGPGEYSGSWTAPGLPCWSLIGRIGNGTPFFIGDSGHANITTPGELFLGVNDETGLFGDNSGSWTVHVTWQPSATCDAAAKHTVVTQHAGLRAYPELFTEKITLSWCADPDSQPRIFSSSQSPKVEGGGFGSLSGIFVELANTAGVTFTVTPETAPTPKIDNGPDSASATASGLSFQQTINLGQDIVALIPSGLLARVGLKLLPILRRGQAGRLITQLRAVWSAAVTRLATAYSEGFGLPTRIAKLLADFELGKLVDAVKDRAEKFVDQAITSLTALGAHPALASVTAALKSAIKTAAAPLTFTKKLWGPKITVKVASGQDPSADGRPSYVAERIKVSAFQVVTTPEG